MTPTGPAGSFCVDGTLDNCERGTLPVDGSKFGQYSESCAECGGIPGSTNEKICLGGNRDAVPCNPGPSPNFWVWGLPSDLAIIDKLVSIAPGKELGMDIGPLQDTVNHYQYLATYFAVPKQGVAAKLGLVSKDNKYIQGSLLRCARNLGLVKEGAFSDQDFIEVDGKGRIKENYQSTVAVRNIVAEALSGLGEGYKTRRESKDE